MSRKQVRRWELIAFRLGLFAVAWWILHRELRHYHYADLVRELRSLPSGRILLAAGLTAVNYAVMTGYDALAMRFVRHRLPYRLIAFASFTGYAVSNTLGFPLLTGAPLRYRLYSQWGVAGVDVLKVIAFNTTTFWL